MSRKITRPYSKLTRLVQEAAKRAGKLTTFAAVAEALGMSPGRVTQMFGYGQDEHGTSVKPETVGRLAAIFTADGATCEIDWFYLDYDDFAARIASSEMRSAATRESVPAEWERNEQNFLPSMVELRLYPPGPGGEVNAKLLFGTALCDYEPEDSERPRTVAIALRDARLTIGSASCGAAEGTMLGEREETKNADYFKLVAGGVDIFGPRQEGVLDGNPIGNHYLGVIEATKAGDEPFEVAVAAHRRSFVVADADASPGAGGVPLDNKDAILNVFIYRRCHRDEENRAVLSEAQIRRADGGQS